MYFNLSSKNVPSIVQQENLKQVNTMNTYNAIIPLSYKLLITSFQTFAEFPVIYHNLKGGQCHSVSHYNALSLTQHKFGVNYLFLWCKTYNLALSLLISYRVILDSSSTQPR